MDLSMKLVGIADQLNNSSFSVVLRLAPSFGIIMLWVIGISILEQKGIVDSQSQVKLFKKGVSDSDTQVSIMNVHNKIEITHAKINCVLKDSSGDTPLPKILMLAILATCTSSSSTINQEQMQRSHSKRGTKCMFSAIGLPLFSNRLSIWLTQDKKRSFLRLVMGLSAK
ncbi:hypothetical protein H5410_031930, partial [Solanum commersonii]